MNDTLGQHRPASITLVRHGESESNVVDAASVDGVPPHLRGTPNHRVKLTERGREQARATGVALAQKFPQGFDYIYMSPYLRTIQTKDGLVEGFPSDWPVKMKEYHIRRDILLREQDFGMPTSSSGPLRTARSSITRVAASRSTS
jgi:broad specificity phosphatase PhoE